MYRGKRLHVHPGVGALVGEGMLGAGGTGKCGAGSN